MAFTPRWTEMQLACIVSVLLFNTIQTVRPMLILQDSLLNTLPVITGLKSSEIRVFRGNISAVDFFHHPHLEDNYFLIGARNVVYNISLSSLSENKRITWYSSDDDVRLCQLRQKSGLECQNYIRVIAKSSKDEYLVCGTNAFRPLCRTYRPGPKRTYSFTDEESGVARCPYDPAHNSTAVYIGKRLYSATVADLSARDSLIFSKPLRTEQHDSQWLNDPNFVSSFGHEGRVYFFFRETAVENINCGKAVFSRVARVCTGDTGGLRVLRNTWTSFFKARLNCSIPGEFPFYFDEILSTSDLGEGNLFPTLVHSDRVHMVYALFSTPRNSLRGTAVCAFKFSEIVSVFEGAYKEQRTAYSNWLPVRESDVPEPHPAKSCPNDSRIMSDQTLNFIKSHPLMDKSIPSFGGRPIIIQMSLGYSFTQIAVDWQVHAADRRYYDVLFIGTDDGKVLKALNRGLGQNIETVIVEVLTLFPAGMPITSLKISKGQGRAKRLIAVSRDEVRTMSLHHCHLKTSCSACVSMKDPYCSWVDGECVHSNKGLQSVETGRHPKCSPDAVVTSSTALPNVSPNWGLCQPCACRDHPVIPMKSNSLQDEETVKPKIVSGIPRPFAVTLPGNRADDVAAEEDEEEKLQEDDSNDGPTAVFRSSPNTFSGSPPCVEEWKNNNSGYPLAVLLLVAFLPAIFTFFFGMVLGSCLAVRKHSRYCPTPESCDVMRSHGSVRKTLCDDEKMDRCSSPNSERYKVVVNELKANNTKQPNSLAESTLQKANLNIL